MTCKRCGQCCQLIGRGRDGAWDGTREQLADLAAQGQPDAGFMLAHWHYCWGTRFYWCDCFDFGSHLCTIYETRPYVCAGYPFYGDYISVPIVDAGCGFAVNPEQASCGLRPR